MNAKIFFALALLTFVLRGNAGGYTELLGKLDWNRNEWKDSASPSHLVVDGHGELHPTPILFTPHFETQADGMVVLKIDSGLSPLPLLTVSDALIKKITKPAYAVLGEVRCESVNSGAYLELQSNFAPLIAGQPQQSRVTQTLGFTGPMGVLVGSQDWREFWLPFNSSNEATKLTNLQVSLVWTGPGRVFLRNLRLVQYVNENQDFLIHQHRIVVNAEWSGNVEYVIDDVRYTNIESVRQKLKNRYLFRAQDNITIVHPKSLGYAELVPLTNAVKEAGFEPGYAQTADSPISSHTKWIIISLGLLLIVSASVVVFVFQYSRRRHERELRRIASLDG